MALPQARTGATIDDLYKVEPASGRDRRRVEIVLMPPARLRLTGRVAARHLRKPAEVRGGVRAGLRHPRQRGLRINLPNRRSYLPRRRVLRWGVQRTEFLEGAPSSPRGPERGGLRPGRRGAPSRPSAPTTSRRARVGLGRRFSARRAAALRFTPNVPGAARVPPRSDGRRRACAAGTAAMVVDAIFKRNPRRCTRSQLRHGASSPRSTTSCDIIPYESMV